MTRANWKNASFPVDEVEDLRIELERAGIRLPPNPGILDLHRARLRDWKKRKSGPPPSQFTSSTPAVGGPIATPSQGAPTSATENLGKGAEVSERSQQLQLDILREKNRLATQQFNIENMRRKKEFWGSVKRGLVSPPERFQSKQTGATVQIRGRHCPIHNVFHEVWPCAEVKKAHEEMGVPLEQ